MKKTIILLLFCALLCMGMVSPQPLGQQPDPKPPATPVKLIFVHHSTGGNWLADPAGNELGGGLGRALMDNHYYVSATNYGWGPDSIGDATDIPNWTDWFNSERSPVILKALYNENQQNFGDFGSWPRLANDPGGENQIIVFKSCFPNSELEGSPNDAASAEGGLNVGHAKFVYNEILKYFATRPDKLFVVVTAPPLSSSPNGANARAFNLWLVNNWLSENNYKLNNVAVFDFYNVLTGANHHHRINNGQVEHIFTTGKNLLVYPSGDDHPSRVGNEKATQEFVPLLNSFYNRWKAGGNTLPVEAKQNEPTAPPADTKNSPQAPAAGDSVFTDGFEREKAGWEAYMDEGGQTQLTCTAANEKAYKGGRSLQIKYAVAKGGWATCSHFFDSPQNWNAFNGISLAIQSASPDITLHIDLYGGSQAERETYYFTYKTPAKTNDWAVINIPWKDFKRADWEANAGTSFSKLDKVLGLAVGFPTDENRANSGILWVDDIHLLGSVADAQQPEKGTAPAQKVIQTVIPLPTQPEKNNATQKKGGLPLCGGAFALPLMAAGWGWWSKKRYNRNQ